MKPGSVNYRLAVTRAAVLKPCGLLPIATPPPPAYVESGVIHFGVPNMPGATPWTATQAP